MFEYFLMNFTYEDALAGSAYEIDLSSIDLNPPDLPDDPALLSGGLMDFLFEALDLISQDQNINALIDNAQTIFDPADQMFYYNITTSHIVTALMTSFAEDFYTELFTEFNWDSLSNYSYQYNLDDDGGWIKDYV